MQFTNNEKKALLILFKDLDNYYNANSLSKKLNISRIGAMKLLKKLKKNDILNSKLIGKSETYKVNLDSDYIRDMLAFLLSDEANNFKRWKNEFKGLFSEDRIVMIYGSAIVNYSKANDIDLMILKRKDKQSNINKVIAERQKILPKKIHLIELSRDEFLKNLEEKQPSILNIAKTSVILYGQSKYVELIKNV